MVLTPPDLGVTIFEFHYIVWIHLYTRIEEIPLISGSGQVEILGLRRVSLDISKELIQTFRGNQTK